MAHIELAEATQLPPHIVEIEHPQFIDPQAHIGGQPGHDVVAHRWRELPGGRDVRAPGVEQSLDLRLRGPNPQPRQIDARGLFISSSGTCTARPPGQGMELGAIAQLKELEVEGQRGSP